MSLKIRLFVIFILISIVPLSIVSIISFNASAKFIRDLELQSKRRELNDIERDVSQILRHIRLVGLRFQFDEAIHDMLLDNFDENALLKRQNELEVRKSLFNYENVQGTYSIHLVTKDGDAFSNQEIDRYYSYTELLKRWTDENTPAGRTFFWGNGEVIKGIAVIPFIHELRDISNGEILGFAVINVLESVFNDVLKKYSVGDPSQFFIINKSGNIISHSDKGFLFSNIEDAYGIIPSKTNLADDFIVRKIDKDDYLLVNKRTHQVDWTYFSSIPINLKMSDVLSIRKLTILLIAVSSAICFFISLAISQRVISPINMLIKQMERTQYSTENIDYHSNSNDEIGKLEKSFFYMMQRLKKSTEEFIRIQEEKKEIELKLLELQINPHFLYNSLSSIIWLSNAGLNKEVMQITKALSDFFRIGLSKGNHIISIREEMKHIESFLEIEKIRYGEKFNTQIKTDSRVIELFTIKIILQPVVENSIYHGVATREDNEGKILIDVSSDTDNVIFSVMDNGIDASLKRAELINNILQDRVSEDREYGIGISNVNKRIKKYFGEKYGLQYFYKDGFTVAKIIIPKIVRRPKDV